VGFGGEIKAGIESYGWPSLRTQVPTLFWRATDCRALESILISVTTALDVEMAVLRKFVNELLTQLEEDIDRERLRNMLVYSKKLSAFEKKATLIRDALAEVLDNGIYSWNRVNCR
jgi:hypothetical protein